MNKREKARSRALNIAAAVCFLLAITLLITIRLFKIESLAQWYDKYNGVLLQFETRMETLDDRWVIVFMIELNFLIKAVAPWFPLSCICVISGVVFRWPVALTINIVGMFQLFSVKYFWGRHISGGNTEKLLVKFHKFYSFIDENRFGGPFMLFISRLIPGLPINSVSQLYGSIDYPYWQYMLLSMLGFSYKLFSFTLIGRNVYNPISAKFIIPLMFLLFFSGMTLLTVNGVFHVAGRERLLKKENN